MADTFEEELVDDLVTNSLLTAKNTDGFMDQLPDVAADPAVGVFNNGGPGANSANPTSQVSITFRVRATDYPTAMSKAGAIYNRWHQEIDTTLDPTRVVYALADGTPGSLGRDSANRSLVSFNVTFGVLGGSQDTTPSGGPGGNKGPWHDLPA